MKKLLIILIWLSLASLHYSCEEEVIFKKEVPTCLNDITNRFLKKPPDKERKEIWEWKLEDKTYYFIPGGCCDQHNQLFDSNCDEVCFPIHGFNPVIDPRCPSLQGTIYKTLVWRDDR